MQIKTVLALTDLGEDSVAGLHAAYAIAKRKDANLVVGHVLVPRTLDPSDVREFLIGHGFDAGAATIDIEIDADILSGIDLLMEQTTPNLVVLSSGRKRGAARLLVASVPVGLVGEVTAPVLALHAGTTFTGFSNALVCVDGSPQSQGLIDAAAALLAADGEMVALMVIEDSPLVVGGIDIGTYDQSVLDKAGAAAETFLRGLRLQRTDVHLRVEHRVGNALDEIKAAREQRGSDLVVIGSGGIGGAARFFFGQVAEDVMRYADVPVLVVPTERQET